MQEGSKPIIESIRDYIVTCPFLQECKVNIDYLGNGMEYSIDPLPSETFIKKYTDGGGIKQQQFAFTSKEFYDGDARTGIENSGFYQKFEEWIENNNKEGVRPELGNSRHTPIQVETMTSGYLFVSDADFARYQIQCRLIYEQEA